MRHVVHALPNRLPLLALLLVTALSLGCGSKTVAPPAGPPVDSIFTYAGTGIPGFNGGGKPRLSSWLYYPCDVTVEDATGSVYIVDWNNHQVREVIAGTDTLHTVAGGTRIANDADLTALNHPSSLALGGDGAVYVAAFHNHQVRANVTLETIPFWGDTPGCTSDVSGPDARFNLPTSLAWGEDSTLYVSVSGCLRIDAVAHDNAVPQERSVATLAGTGARGFSGDNGPAADATFDAPTSSIEPTAFRIAVSPDKRFLYVADSNNNRVRRIALDDPQHTITTVAGSDSAGFAGDDGPATAARLRFPTDVEVDTDGSLFICDMGNNAIRKVDANGVIHTVAGEGRAGFSGDGGAASTARFNQPNGIGLDRVRRLLYVADQLNHRVRVVRLLH